MRARCAAAFDAITGDDDSICVDRLGGDCVERGCTAPQNWHSEWSDLKIGGSGGHEVALGISIAVTEVTEAMGFISEGDGCHGKALAGAYKRIPGDHCVSDA